MADAPVAGPGSGSLPAFLRQPDGIQLYFSRILLTSAPVVPVQAVVLEGLGQMLGGGAVGPG